MYPVTYKPPNFEVNLLLSLGLYVLERLDCVSDGKNIEFQSQTDRRHNGEAMARQKSPLLSEVKER